MVVGIPPHFATRISSTFSAPTGYARERINGTAATQQADHACKYRVLCAVDAQQGNEQRQSYKKSWITRALRS
jgi:hypothetical protein